MGDYIMADFIVLTGTTGPTYFHSEIPNHFFSNIDAAAEEFIQNRRHSSPYTISGILGVSNISKDSDSYKNIARKIRAYAQHM